MDSQEEKIQMIFGIAQSFPEWLSQFDLWTHSLGLSSQQVQISLVLFLLIDISIILLALKGLLSWLFSLGATGKTLKTLEGEVHSLREDLEALKKQTLEANSVNANLPSPQFHFKSDKAEI